MRSHPQTNSAMSTRTNPPWRGRSRGIDLASRLDIGYAACGDAAKLLFFSDLGLPARVFRAISRFLRAFAFEGSSFWASCKLGYGLVDPAAVEENAARLMRA